MLLAVNFHYIREDFTAPYPAIFGKTPKAFRDQLELLSGFGEFVSPRQISDFLTSGNSLPEKAILITFDDGLKEQYELAKPILDQMGIPAVYFVNTRTLEEKKLLKVHLIHKVRSLLPPSEILEHFMGLEEYRGLGKSEKEKLKAYGVSHYLYDSEENAFLKYLLNFVFTDEAVNAAFDHLFKEVLHLDPAKEHESLYMSSDQIGALGRNDAVGSHSHDHLPVGLLTEEQAKEQVIRSVQMLNDLGISPSAFSYPYGSEEAVGEVSSWLGDFGFSFALTMKRGSNSGLDNPMRLNRYDNNDVPGGKSFKPDSGEPFFQHLK